MNRWELYYTGAQQKRSSVHEEKRILNKNEIYLKNTNIYKSDGIVYAVTRHAIDS